MVQHNVKRVIHATIIRRYFSYFKVGQDLKSTYIKCKRRSHSQSFNFGLDLVQSEHFHA